jgi:hypothetical protein
VASVSGHRTQGSRLGPLWLRAAATGLVAGVLWGIGSDPVIGRGQLDLVNVMLAVSVGINAALLVVVVRLSSGSPPS